jgi:putative transposase
MKKQTNCHYAIFYHIILTVKYRKRIINKYDEDIKCIITELSNRCNFNVEKIESDRDHIHLLVSTRPDISPSYLIKQIKQKTTYELWQKYPNQLQKEFWKKHVFWNRSYFVASIGSVSREAIERYIANQGSSSITLKG